MFNFEQFQEFIKDHIREYLPDDWANAEIDMHMVQKNNGKELSAILVKSEDSNIVPTIYLESFFSQYESGRNIQSVLEEIADIAIANQGKPEIEDIAIKFSDFDFVKDRVVVVAVNAEKNKAMLENTPHTMREDLALIYKVMVDTKDDCYGTITVKDEHMKLWGIDQPTLHEYAIANSREVLPGKVQDLTSLVAEMMGEGFVEEGFTEETMGSMENTMFVITNEKKTNGAAVIFYDEHILADLSEKLGCDLYILPSSIHECIAIPAHDADPQVLSQMVVDVNSTEVEEMEILSDHVYHYDAKSRTLSIADTTAKQLEISENQEQTENRHRSRKYR